MPIALVPLIIVWLDSTSSMHCTFGRQCHALHCPFRTLPQNLCTVTVHKARGWSRITQSHSRTPPWVALDSGPPTVWHTRPVVQWCSGGIDLSADDAAWPVCTVSGRGALLPVSGWHVMCPSIPTTFFTKGAVGPVGAVSRDPHQLQVGWSVVWHAWYGTLHRMLWKRWSSRARGSP